MSTTEVSVSKAYSAERVSAGIYPLPSIDGSYCVNIRIGGQVSASGNAVTGIREASGESKRAGRDAVRPKVTRRLKGFFVQAEGQDARVAIVDGGALIHYHLPIKLFHDAGVHAENQPFELDELEAVVDGAILSGHKVRPSAPATAGVVTPLPLNEDYKEKLRKVLHPRKW